MRGLNKFLKNKNTVTVLGIILILVLLYIGYTATIKATVDPIQVPVAKEKILPSTQITADKLQYKNVSKAVLTDSTYRFANEVVGLYTNVNVTVPAGSMLYKEWLVSGENLPGNWLKKIDFSKGEEAYYFGVTVASTFGNSILPNSYIDIYMKAYDEKNNVMYGKLFKGIQVLAVHDASGQDVFSDSENIKTPANLVFAMSHDNYNLLMRAEYLSSTGIDLVIAPQGENTESEGTLVSSATLRDYINVHTSSVTDDQIEKELEENNANNKDKHNANSSVTEKIFGSLTR